MVRIYNTRLYNIIISTLKQFQPLILFSFFFSLFLCFPLILFDLHFIFQYNLTNNNIIINHTFFLHILYFKFSQTDINFFQNI